MGTKKQNAACRKARAAKARKTAKKSLGCAKKLSGCKTKKRKSLNGVVADVASTAGNAAKKAKAINPTAVKVVVGAGAAGLTFLIGRKIWNTIKKTREANRDEKAAENIDVDMSKVTMTVNDAQNLAGEIVAACNGWGTKDSVIERIFENDIKTGDDYLLLKREFGSRPYKWGGYSENGTRMNLISWLREELGNRKMAKLEERIRNLGVKP